MIYLGKNYIKFCEDLATALSENIKNFQRDNDIENVHKIRTSIRKLRGIIKFFNLSEELDQEIKKIADSLTSLRDLEVQLEFLNLYPEIIEIKREKTLLWEMTKNTVIKEIPNFKKDRFLSKLSKELENSSISSLDVFKKLENNMGKLLHLLSETIIQSLENEREIEKIHALRINLKKVVYLLEAAACENMKILDIIDRLKKLQTLLGEIHDLYIFEVDLEKDSRGKKLGEERETLITIFNEQIGSNSKFFRDNLDEIFAILRDIVKTFKEDILRKICDKELAFTLMKDNDIEFLQTDFGKQLHSAELLSNRFSPDRQHIKRVVEKSQAIVEALTPICRFSERELFTLLISAFLHDIGHFFGEKNHNLSSKEMVYRSRYLELDFISKIKIGWIVESHRGEIKDRGELNIFQKSEIKKIKLLAAILRAADGMEYESSEYIKDYHFQLGEKELLLSCEKISKKLQKRFMEKAQFLSKMIELPIKFMID